MNTTIKLRILLLAFAASAINMNAATTVSSVTDYFWNFSSWTTQTISSTTTIDNMEVAASRTGTVSVASSSKTISGTAFTKCVKMGGKGSSSSRHLHFNVAGPCTITIYATSSNTSSTRQLNIDAGSFVGTGSSKTHAAKLTIGTSAAAYTYSYTGTSSSDIYLYSENGGINFYGVQVVADASSSSDSGSSSSSGSNSSSSSDSSSLSAVSSYTWNISDWTAQTISSTKIIDNMEVAASASKTVVIDASSQSYDGYTFTKRLKLGGTASSTTRFIHFKVAGAATITVYGSSANTSTRTMKLDAGSFGNTVASLSTASLSKLTYDYTGTEATDIYVYSANSGFNIYGVVVTASDSDGSGITEETLTDGFYIKSTEMEEGY